MFALKMQALLKFNIAGLMCAMAAAHPQLYLQGRGSMPHELITDKVEFDLRGHIEVLPGQYAYIDIGEMKTAPKYRYDVSHLGLRLGLLKWMVQKGADVPQGQICLVGRLFVSKTDANSRRVCSQQQTRARSDWGFTLHLHFV